MTSLTFFGGVDEIGGNKILLEEKDSRVFLDFGVSYRAADLFFDFPLLQPTNLEDLIKTSLLPPLSGLYKNKGLQPVYDASLGAVAVEGNPEKPEINGILLTHAHQDHYGYLGLVRPDIPVYVSPITKKLVKLRNEISGGFRDKVKEDSLHPVQEDEEFQIGSLRIKRFDVDHSVPGASAYVIRTEAGVVAYTGDFRFHGVNARQSENFLEVLKKEKVDYLICEGTRLPQEGTAEHEEETRVLGSEQDVISKCVELVRSEPGLVVYDASPADIGRLLLLCTVARESKRKLVIDSRVAYLALFLNYGEASPLLDGIPGVDEITILLGRRKLGSNTRRFKELNVTELYAETYADGRDSYERQLIEVSGGKVLWGPLRKKLLEDPGEYILYTSNGPLTLLHLLEPGCALSGLYVYGKAEPFTEEMEFSFARLLNWLSLANLRLEYAHTSGHIFPEHLARFLGEAQPHTVIPIHTLNAKGFEAIAKKVLYVQQGKKFQI